MARSVNWIMIDDGNLAVPKTILLLIGQMLVVTISI
jgi:hypothetical protein